MTLFRPARIAIQRASSVALLPDFFSLIAAPAFAKERAFHVLNQSNGIPVSSLSGFAQDSEGFFWFGTAAGLYRYDGAEFRQWAKDKIAGGFYEVRAGPDGEVLVTCSPDNTLYRVLPNQDAETVIGTDGKPFSHVTMLSLRKTEGCGFPNWKHCFIERATTMGGNAA